MNPADTDLVVKTAVALMGAVTIWLTYKAQDHSYKLNGLMGQRIKDGAETAIAADHAARDEKHTLKQP